MPNEELSYVIVTPYSMRKSRTGGIIARLISRTGLDLVAAADVRAERGAGQALRGHDRHRDRPAASGDPGTDPRLRPEEFHRQRERPEAARADARFSRAGRGREGPSHVGHIVHERTSGETIRDTFGDYITDDSGKVVYFEPAVLAAFDPKAVERDLKLWAEFSDTDGGILDRVIEFPKDAKVEKTLVLIKPDNFKFPNLRPGGVIEVFSRTGLYIIGFKVHRMSVAQAEEFYGPVLAVLEDKLGAEKGRNAWEDIVEFMSGGRPSATSDDQRNAPGSEKCIAIVYQGEDAVRKIRDVLGPTDPEQGASRIDPEGIRPDDHGQRRPRLRFRRKREARDGDRPGRRE